MIFMVYGWGVYWTFTCIIKTLTFGFTAHKFKGFISVCLCESVILLTDVCKENKDSHHLPTKTCIYRRILLARGIAEMKAIHGCTRPCKAYIIHIYIHSLDQHRVLFLLVYL